MKRLLAPLCCLLAVLPAPAETPAAQATRDYLALSRDLLSKYYETQKLLAKEESDWKTGREILDSRLSLLQAQLKELTEKTAEQQKTITVNDTEREKLDAQNRELLASQDMQVEAIRKLEERVHRLWPLLPGALQEKIRGQYERLPKAGMKVSDIQAAAGERFVNVLIVINEVNKFHSDVAVLNERRRLADGRELEVRVIYFGLAAAYFAGSGDTAQVGGMLVPGPQGWLAVEDPQIAPLVDRVIAMQKGDQVAGFVSLPVKIR